jgi:hypothetical protein
MRELPFVAELCMDPLHAFDSLAGVRPGESAISEVISRFGWREPSAMSGGGLFYSFDEEGIRAVCSSRPEASGIR